MCSAQSVLKSFCFGVVFCAGISAGVVHGQDHSEVALNPGFNGAWYNPDTAGQGFLLDVLPDTNIVFLAWFTYDTAQPGQSETAQVGHPGHRWLTAQGPISGNRANLDANLTSGGLFDDPSPVTTTSAGSMTLTFENCAAGTLDYQLTSSGVSGSIPVSRVANDNVGLCESIGKASGLNLSKVEKPTTPNMAGNKPIPEFQTLAVAKNCKLNPGHSGAWYNPDTAGQGFLLDVLPDTNIAFLAWFTYDTAQPGQNETAQVGHPGHRWLTAQGPLNGNTANLDAYLTSGGQFDDPAPAVNTPAGSITLTFDSCSSGTVNYELASAGVSGSIPISRIVNDNVALCESLCSEIVAEESRKQSGFYGLEGGVLEVVDSQANVSRLTIPEGILVGSRDQLIEASPLAQQTTLPTGQSAIAGLKWSLAPGLLLGPVKLEIFTENAGQYTDLAAFSFGNQGETFYFVPVFFKEDSGVVLEVPHVYPGISGLAFLTADEMEKWTPPANPPEARYLQRMAVAVKRAAESGGFQQSVSKDQFMTGQLEAAGGDKTLADPPSYSELMLPHMKEWFDKEVSPKLGAANGGCDAVADFVAAAVLWLSWIQEAGLDDHIELYSRISSLEFALENFAAAAGQDISSMDRACESEPDPCKQMAIMQEGAVCAQTLQHLGPDSSVPELACSSAPALLSISPKNTSRCSGGNIQFYAIVRNIKGEALPVDQVNLNWSSNSEHVLSIDQESGAATAHAEGFAWVTASSKVCGNKLEGSAHVKIDGEPDITGSYSMVGSETVWGCIDPEYNGTYGGTGSAKISMGSNGQSGTKSFTGTSSGRGFGHNFSGTVSCGGSLSGSGTYVETEPDCGDCTTTGISKFTGSFSGDTIMIDGTGQDQSGDTCSSRGWARATRK